MLERLSGNGPSSGCCRCHGECGRGLRHRGGRDAQHLGQCGASHCAGSRTGRPARQGGRSAVHLWLCVELGGAVDAGRTHSQCGHPFGRRQPRQHDRRHPPFARRQGHLEAQRLARPGPQAEGGRRPPQDRGVRISLFDGWRHCPDPRDRRGGRSAWRDDLYRRGACGGHVRPARWRRFRTRWAGRPDHPDRGHPGQGLRRGWRVRHRLCRPVRLHPVLCQRLHLYHCPAPGHCRRRHSLDRAPQGKRH